MKKQTRAFAFTVTVIILAIFASCSKPDLQPAKPAILPGVTTSAITNITKETADGGGSVTSDGNDVVTERGVCWNTSPSPTIANPKTSDSSGTGTFSSSITGLEPNKTYYVRAYATNSKGTAYGNEVSFQTEKVPAVLPTVTTADTSNVSDTSAVLGGTVTADGFDSVTARGVCWSTSPDPTITDAHTTDGSDTGRFVSNLSGLVPGTTYYVRAYATNSVGTAYGNPVTFTTRAYTIRGVVVNSAKLFTHYTENPTQLFMSDGGIPGGDYIDLRSDDGNDLTIELINANDDSMTVTPDGASYIVKYKNVVQGSASQTANLSDTSKLLYVRIKGFNPATYGYNEIDAFLSDDQSNNSGIILVGVLNPPITTSLIEQAFDHPVGINTLYLHP